MLSACKRTVGGLAVGVLLSAAAAALPAVGDIGQGTAVAQRGSHLAAGPVTTLQPPTDRYGVAELLLKRTIAIDEKVHGPDHPGLATSLNKLATLYQATGRHQAAEPLLQRTIAIDEKALGPEHPDLAGRLNNLAVLYWATDRAAKAEPLFARALAILDKSLPPDHPALAAVRENHANLLVQLGHREETSAARECGSRPCLARSRNVPIRCCSRTGQLAGPDRPLQAPASPGWRQPAGT